MFHFHATSGSAVTTFRRLSHSTSVLHYGALLFAVVPLPSDVAAAAVVARGANPPMVVSGRAKPVMLDGGTSLPATQGVSYAFRCPDGLVRMEVTQRRGAVPSLMQLSYSGRSLLRVAKMPIDKFLGQLRSLETVSPRCLTAGGAEMLLGGTKRDEVPSKHFVVGVTIDKHGRVSLD